MNAFEDFHRRLTRVEEAVRRTSAAPTIPRYDSTNFPQDAVHGQIAKDQNEKMWVFGNDDAWHLIGKADLSYLYAESPNASAAGLTTYYPSWSTSAGFVQTNDHSLFSLDSGDHTKLVIQEPGIYLAVFGVTPNPIPTNATVGFDIAMMAENAINTRVNFTPLNTINVLDIPKDIGHLQGAGVAVLLNQSLPWKARLEFNFNSSSQTYQFQAVTNIIKLASTLPS